jgi:RNA polymerase sigma-54 factor
MKYFFGSSVQSTSGETVASKSVKEEIKQLIAKEDPKKPHSDCEIVDLLKGRGINIARRTVAKYREMTGILPSSKRKKYF